MISIEGSAPQLPEFRSLSVETEIAARMDLLPDGREVVVTGDSDLAPWFFSAVSDSAVDHEESGSFLGCAQIIREFVPDFNARELREYSEPDGPQTDRDPSPFGSAALESLAQTLADFDVPAHVERAQSSEDLAHYLESGNGVLVAVNQGELWNSPTHFGAGDANSVVVALAVARDPLNGDILGWYLNDGVAKQARALIDAPTMQRAWLDAGGWLVVTEIVRRRSE